MGTVHETPVCVLHRPSQDGTGGPNKPSCLGWEACVWENLEDGSLTTFTLVLTSLTASVWGYGSPGYRKTVFLCSGELSLVPGTSEIPVCTFKF